MTQLIVLAVLIELFVDATKCAFKGTRSDGGEPADLRVRRDVGEVREDDRLLLIAMGLRWRLQARTVHPANKGAGRFHDGAHELGQELVDFAKGGRNNHLGSGKDSAHAEERRSGGAGGIR
eukprot:scaffold118511_cov28-Tisochrysis_lutea.AAC.4